MNEKLYIVNNKNADGFTMLHLAILNDQLEIVKLLLGNKKINALIDINSVNLQLQTPLHIAVGKKCLESIQLLLNAKSKVNVRDIKGNTPFHYFVRTLIIESKPIEEDSILYKIAYLLIDNHADLTIENFKNQTPLDLIADVEFQKKIQNYNSKIYLEKCFICKSNRRSVLIKPCAHILTCNLCAPKIKECLICSGLAKEYIQLEECLICFEKRANVLFKPCNHIVACDDCFDKLNLKKCLKCRTVIKKEFKFSNDNCAKKSKFYISEFHVKNLQNYLQDLKEKVRHIFFC
jgi:E3 ubiquitin-protein ligase mind-bomb